MENLFFSIKHINLTPLETISYFSIHIFCLISIILNFVLLIFLRKKSETKRLSDFITNGTFILNSLVLLGIYLKSNFSTGEINFTAFNDRVIFDNSTILLQLAINIFAFLFLSLSYKITRKARFKTSLINATLLFIVFISCVIVQLQNELLTYFLLGILSFSIYKFASNSRMRRDDFYSIDFLITNVCADALFYSLFITTFFIKDIMQINIIQVCLTCAFLLKVGIFPIYNYSICKNYKTDLPYSILLFVFYPTIGIIALEKIIHNISTTNEIFQITILTFLTLAIITSSFNAFKTKNLVKFLANFSYTICAFCICGLMFNNDYIACFKLIACYAFCFLGLFGLINIININFNQEKINLNLIKGAFFKNPLFSILFSILLLISTSVLPSQISQLNIQILKNIYSFDKIGIFFIAFAIISNILILFNSLRIIQKIYGFSKKELMQKFTKRTTYNYVVPIIIILILLISIFL